MKELELKKIFVDKMMSKKLYFQLSYVISGVDSKNRGMEFENFSPSEAEHEKWLGASHYLQLCGELEQEILKDFITHRSNDSWYTSYDKFIDWKGLGFPGLCIKGIESYEKLYNYS